MRPQVHISLIGAACALVVLAAGTIASLSETSSLSDVGVGAAAPTPTIAASLSPPARAAIAPTRIAPVPPTLPAAIVNVEPFTSPRRPPRPTAPRAQSVAAERGTPTLTPTFMSPPTVEPATAAAAPSTPTPTRKSRVDRLPRPANNSTPTAAAEPTATSPMVATPAATALLPRKRPQATTTAESPLPTGDVEPPQPTVHAKPTATVEPPVGAPRPTEEPFSSLDKVIG